MSQQSSDIQLLKKLAQSTDNIRSEIGKIIVGQHDVVDQLLVSLFARGHFLVVGVPCLAIILLLLTFAMACDF